MKILFILIYTFITLSTFAQVDSIRISPVKYLSDQQYAAYKNGNALDMGLIAEVNGYPSPIKALALSNRLQLSTIQKNQLQVIATELKRKNKEMGEFIFDQETKLNSLFASQKINEGSLIYFTNKIGALQGELRNAYLKAHFRTRKILNPTQLKIYKELSNAIQ